MNGGPCLRRRTMMGRGADGGCGTEEKPCPISRVPAKIPAAEVAATAEELPALEKRTEAALDLYTQARKALTVLSPFDSEDVQASTTPNLPGELANYLSRQSDNRKRKKSHSGVETKSKRGGGAEKGRGSSIWDETGDCFRELTVEDVEKIEQLSNLVNSAFEKYLSVPVPGNVDNSSSDGGIAVGNAGNVVIRAGGENANIGVVESVVVQGEAKLEEPAHFMEVDNVGVSTLPEVENDGSFSSSQLGTSCSGLEWLLGSRKKVHLTTERPSKKRKLLGVDAGLEKLVMVRQVSGLSTLCDCCSLGDSGNPLNGIIICSSCSVAVHERCYGVLDDGGGSWLCSWCKEKSAVKNLDRPCVLCPKSHGALKPVSRTCNGRENGGPMEFAHLFCCQWMPEVYLEDTRTMDPVMNIKGIAESRRKLICYLCKVKFGACLRCSFGACRTSFHPMCAREAGNRMEIWGKFGCDDVELRAFCSKHTDDQTGDSTKQSGNAPVVVGFNSSISVQQPVATTGNVVSTTGIRPHKLKIGRKNGDKIAVRIEVAETNVSKSSDSALCEGNSDIRSHTTVQLQSSNSTQPTNAEGWEKGTNGDVNSSGSLDFVAVLQKLIERGKVRIDHVASEIGSSPEILASMLTGNHLAPELRQDIATWLKNHAYIGSSQKNLRVKFKSSIKPKDDVGAATHSDTAGVSDSVAPDCLPIRSVPPRRRTKSNIRILKDNKVISPSEEARCDNRNLDKAQGDELISKDSDILSKESLPDAMQKKLMEPYGHIDTLSGNFHGGEGDSAKPFDVRLAESDPAQVPSLSENNGTPNSDARNTCFLVRDSDVTETEAVSRSDFHPLLCKTTRIQSLGLPNNAICSSNTDVSSMDASLGSDTCCNQHIGQWMSSDMKSDRMMSEQLVNDRSMGHLEMCPKDEVEGELIYHQHKLLNRAVARQRFSDELIGKVVRNLPQEIDMSASRKWDAVFVSQYLSEVREAKKQGRKEKRHKEAQAVLAAATAAAAASSRISSVRKDVFDEAAHQESPLNVSQSSGRGRGPSSQQLSQPNQSLQKMGAPPVSTDTKSNFVKSVSASSKDQPRTCDICRRAETILNPVLVCSSCKVLVHSDCYRSVKDSAGPWHCELCEDILSKSSGVQAVNPWQPTAECGLCGGNDGAFRKSINGQWVHAFCAEWVLESTFKRGQAGAVQGLESVLKGAVVCNICHRKEGVCIKCNYGNCQSTFHPLCARRSGLHMTVKTCGGKVLHKAYCQRHSSEQKAKGDKHGIEELKSLKQIRVELERLRLLCERIIKREKLKRELVVCSQDILVSNRDSVALTALIHSPFFPADVSSESATTSLRGNTDDCRSGSDAIQRSDDVTVDSTVSGKRRVRFPVSMDIDQKDDNSSTSQHLYMKPMERVTSSGKQIPHRPLSISQNPGDDYEKKLKSRKHAETFKKELVMTSDQACVRNQRLPKGIFYVPVGSLSKEKETVPDALSGKTVDDDDDDDDG